MAGTSTRHAPGDLRESALVLTIGVLAASSVLSNSLYILVVGLIALAVGLSGFIRSRLYKRTLIVIGAVCLFLAAAAMIDISLGTTSISVS